MGKFRLFDSLLEEIEEGKAFRRAHTATTIVSDDKSTIRPFLTKAGLNEMREQIDTALANSQADTLLVAADMPMLRYVCKTARAMGMRTVAVEPNEIAAAKLSDERRANIERNKGMADETVTLEKGRDVAGYIANRVSSATCFTVGTQGIVDDFKRAVEGASLWYDKPNVTVTDVLALEKSAEGAEDRQVTVAVTGHRPDKLFGYDTSDPRYDLLRNRISAKFDELGATHLITGMALGFDQIAFEVAKERGMKVTATVPFEGQESNWPESSQRTYHKLLQQADGVVTVSSGGYSADKMQDRNEWMVDHADSIVACWDGSDGGTRNCVRYAENKGKPIETIRPQEILHAYDDILMTKGDKELSKAIDIIRNPERNIAALVSDGAKQMFGYDTNDPGYQACRAWLSDELDKCDADTLVVCADSGLPMVAAELAVERGMTLVLAEPYDGVGQRWPNASRAKLQHLRDKAAANPHINEGSYSADKMRNTQAWVAKSADTCLAIGGDVTKMYRGPLHAAAIRRPMCDIVFAPTKDVVAAYQKQAKAPTEKNPTPAGAARTPISEDFASPSEADYSRDITL